MAKKLTYENFKKRIDEIFDKKIDVSKFIYVNSNTKGLCKCQTCGNEWYAVPNSLLNGHGCRMCYNRKNSESRKISFDEIKKISLGNSVLREGYLFVTNRLIFLIEL